MASTPTIKGQVIIPKQIRDALDLSPGSSVEFDVNQDDEVVLLKAEGPYASRARIALPKREARPM